MSASLWNVTNNEYHADTEKIGATMLKTVLDSPGEYNELYVAKTRHKDQTPDQVLGSILHVLVLQPGLLDSLYIVAPDGIDRRTKEGRQKWDEFIKQSSGKQVVTSDTMDHARAMADSVLNEPTLKLWLDASHCKMVEQAITWQENGLTFKCKPDWFLSFMHEPHDLHLDLKKSNDPTPKNWMSMSSFSPMCKYRYDLQVASHYCIGVEAYTGRPCLSGVVVVGDDPPHDVYIYGTSSYRILGQSWRNRAIERLLKCQDTGEWRDPARDNVISLPEPQTYMFPLGDV